MFAKREHCQPEGFWRQVAVQPGLKEAWDSARIVLTLDKLVNPKTNLGADETLVLGYHSIFGTREKLPSSAHQT